MPELPIESYQVARSIAQAIALRRRLGKRGAYLAGGTRLFRAERRDRLAVVDIGRLGLDRIAKEKDRVVIGATVTLQALMEDRTARSIADGLLADACASTASWMARNAATIGGLVADGAPELDLLTALLAAGAVVQTRDRGSRREPLPSFLGKRRAPEALIVSVVLPLAKRSRGAFLRLSRTANDVSLVSVAAVLHDGRVRLAAGGASPGPRRLPRTEAFLAGNDLSSEVARRAAALAAEESAFRGDARASASYRRAMVGVLTGRVLERLLAG